MKIGIVGCAGRMGRYLLQAVLQGDGLDLAGGTEMPGSPWIGKDPALLAGAEESGLTIGDDADALFAAADCVIDFTLPVATITHAELATKHDTALVIGTTGLGADQQAALDKAAQKVAVVQAANFSVGVNLLAALTRQVSAILADDYDIEIVEMHHNKKVDAPSGTALALGRAAAEGRGVDLDQVSDRVRDGHTGARQQGHIGFATLRGGDVVGEHTVMFAGPAERIELTHKAADRALFARGAIRAARWTEGRPAGLYGMDDVLGLS